MKARSMWLGVLSCLALAGCAKNPGAASTTALAKRDASGGLQSVPTDPDTILSQLKRFRGQTKFLNYEGTNGGLQSGAVRAEAAMDKGGAGREFQESDVFKIGKANSKLLYLLNNYRGLQVVSFKDGVDQKGVKLVSRVGATGNFPQDMYYSGKDDRLYVLERASYDQDDPYNNEQKSKLLVYDVSKDDAPVLKTSLKFEGELADSRFDQTNGILYVATSTYGNSGGGGMFGGIGFGRPRPSARGESKGLVLSFKITGDKIEEKGKLQLASPVSSRQNMNIVEADGKYYLLAILSDSPWGWWDRKSSVEVVDISNIEGKISPVMTVTGKGAVAKRSQTYVKNNTLVVVSSYDSDKKTQQGRAIQRIAVETFNFPKQGIKPITKELADLRKQRITYIMTHTTFEDPEERDAKYKELVESKVDGVDGGLRGRVVDMGEGRLQKVVADSEITVGASTPAGGGDPMSAQLNDVRVQENLLFVTWVPTNLIDPLDVFDISAPEKGLTKEKHHVGHHEFEGWLVRAQPVVYEKKSYLIGLGFEQNENVRRPTAKLFEIDTTNLAEPKEGIRPLKIADKGSLIMKGGNVWVDFDRQDKYVEFRLGANGKGSVLFGISSWGAKPFSGGKLLGIDLSKAGNAGVFTEGTVIAGDAGWLRRVFSNPELGTLHTFSDQQLATFQVAGVGDAKQVATAISMLELARNVRGYERLGKYGVQIVESGYVANRRPTLQFRLVDSKRPDAEITEVKQPILQVAAGRYVSHLNTGDALLVLSENSEYKAATETEEGSTTTTYTVTKIVLDADKLAQVNTTWSHVQPYRRFDGKPQPELTPEESLKQNSSYRSYSASGLVKTSEGQYIVNTAQDLRVLTVGAALATTKIDTAGCTTTTVLEGGKLAVTVNVQMHSNVPYATFTQYLLDKDKKGVTYARHFLANVKIEKDKATCTNTVNVPGKTVLVSKDKYAVSDDQKVTDILTTKTDDGKRTYYSAKSEALLVSLKLDGKTATLVDSYDPSPAGTYSMKAFGSSKPSLAFVQNAQYGESSDFAVLSVDDQFRFVKDSHVIPVNMGKYTQLSSLHPVTVKDAGRGVESFLVILTSNSRMAVLGWDVLGRKPLLKKLVDVDEKGTQVKEETDTVRLSGYYWGSERGTHYSADTNTLEFAQGMQGVKQVYVK